VGLVSAGASFPKQQGLRGSQARILPEQSAAFDQLSWPSSFALS
jgi:hypothetical protein